MNIAIRFYLFIAASILVSSASKVSAQSNVEVISLEPVLFDLGVTDSEDDAIPIKSVEDIEGFINPKSGQKPPKGVRLRFNTFPFEGMDIDPTGNLLILQFDSRIVSDTLNPESDALLVGIQNGKAHSGNIIKGIEGSSLSSVAFVGPKTIRLTYIESVDGVAGKVHGYRYHHLFRSITSGQTFNLTTVVAEVPKGESVLLIRAISKFHYVAHTLSKRTGEHLRVYYFDPEEAAGHFLGELPLKELDRLGMRASSSAGLIIHNPVDRRDIVDCGNEVCSIRTSVPVEASSYRNARKIEFTMGPQKISYRDLTQSEPLVDVHLSSLKAKRSGKTISIGRSKWTLPLETGGDIVRVNGGFHTSTANHPHYQTWFLPDGGGEAQLLIRERLPIDTHCSSMVVGIGNRPSPDMGLGLFRVRLKN